MSVQSYFNAVGNSFLGSVTNVAYCVQDKFSTVTHNALYESTLAVIKKKLGDALGKEVDPNNSEVIIKPLTSRINVDLQNTIYVDINEDLMPLAGAALVSFILVVVMLIIRCFFRCQGR